MYASQYIVIPLPGILTYTKCMLVHAPYHTSYISTYFQLPLTLSHVWGMTFVVPSCTWYKQLIVHIDAPILAFNHNHKIGYPLKASFAKVNSSLTSTVHFGCHQPKLINHLSRSSTRMPLAEAEAIIPLSRSSIRMPLAEANQSFVLVIHLDAFSRS